MTPRNSSLRPLLAAAVIVLAGLAAYRNCFSGPFVFDDGPTVQENATIRHLWPIWGPLHPPHNGSTAEGRPLVNLSLALNYAISGENVWSYHVFNLAIHLLAGLVLFGIVRRTLERGQVAKVDLGARGQLLQPDPLTFASAVALLWTVHPLQTESVTFISDRAESLMGLFYLLTLYCFACGVDEGVRPQTLIPRSGNQCRGLTPSVWLCLSVLSCYLGMVTKEVMATAPILVLLYDRTFVAGNFREALRCRWAYYAGLASSWLPLGLLVAGMGGNRGQVAGFGTSVLWWVYAITQCRAVVHYLHLAVWPHPLVLDYGRALEVSLLAVLPQAILLLLLLAATIVALRRRPALGFLGAWFFAILAPSSSVIPLASQTMAEHRMYLPLAAVVVLGVLGIRRVLSALGMGSAAFLVVVAALATCLGAMTATRNEDYRTELRLWEVTVRDCPGNGYAHYNLACNLGREPGYLAEAITEYRESLRLIPGYAPAHNNLGNALANQPGGQSEAMREYRAALSIDPGYAEAHNNLGMALANQSGSLPEAVAEFQAALRIKPDYADAHINLGNVLAGIPGRMPDAIAEYESALRAKPESVEAHFNLGNAFALTPGRQVDAIVQFEEVLHIRPGFAPAELMIRQLRGR
jgi:Tfp pilus assembly protein PilF